MKQIILTLIFGVYCITLCGCMKETITDTSHQTQSAVLPYLSLTPPLDTKDKMKNLEIMKEAEKRIRPYIKPVGQHLTLTIESGKEINISENIYNLFVKKINKHNQFISLKNFPRIRKKQSEAASEY